MEFRTEKDSMGEVQIPKNKLWGAQTERSRLNFNIGPSGSMPIEIIRAYAHIKKAAAIVNHKLDVLSKEKKERIVAVCDEVLNGMHVDQFPLVIWQTGSGTQTNMNVNEVISNRSEMLNIGNLDGHERYLHPNDDVNKSQSSNDTFPTAMHIASYTALRKKLIPSLTELRNGFDKIAVDFQDVIKIGRTHLMDATPLTIGQEFNAFKSQMDHNLLKIEQALSGLEELPIGGTAVGTGLNTPADFDSEIIKELNQLVEGTFKVAPSKFELIAAHEPLLDISSALKRTAVSLVKIANDIRFLSSGPRSGIGELSIPANEPGSSIMPGKVNPTQIEALTMVCAQVIGNDAAITFAASQGQLQLNAYKPVIISNVLESINLLADAMKSFLDNCLSGLRPNRKQIQLNLDHSLMLVTALNKHIGYEKASKIAKYAYDNDCSLKEAGMHLGFLTSDEYDLWVNPKDMI